MRNCQQFEIEFELPFEFWRFGALKVRNCQQFEIEFELSLEFWRFGALRLRNCQQFDVEFELSLEFWGPWIAKTRARAKVFDEIVNFAK